MMKKILKFLLCCILSFGILYIVGFGIWSGNLSEGEALLALFGSTLILASLAFSVWELYLKQKNEMKALLERIARLEAQQRENR